MSLKNRILAVAVRLSRQNGLMMFTRETVAEQADCSEGNVSYHFGTVGKLREAVIDYAVEHEIIEVISQARAFKHPALGRMSQELRDRVAAHIART